MENSVQQGERKTENGLRTDINDGWGKNPLRSVIRALSGGMNELIAHDSGSSNLCIFKIKYLCKPIWGKNAWLKHGEKKKKKEIRNQTEHIFRFTDCGLQYS